MKQLNLIDFLESEETRPGTEVDIRGICDDGYCPKCGQSLDDLIDRCPTCYTKLSWTIWKRLNTEEET